MPFVKDQPLSDADQHLIQLSKALAHPARLSILNLMRERNTCICRDLTEELGLSQSTISQHLKELKDAGLIYGTEAAQKTYYCIDLKRWNQAEQLFATYFNTLPKI
ncbi:MAG: metalloregulator ArsR/SmtB family transcription factor [Cytophagaceae bacterium]|jgi:predicted transcriptional regulator|nr:metalloregulator ArsR/SmtB family transcription factor [Cytophagaceae bacterium]